MRKIQGIFVLMLLLSLSLSGCGRPDSDSEQPENEASQIEADEAKPVETMVVQTKTIDERILNLGEIEAGAVYEIPSGTGTVKNLSVSVGDTVELDQVLFELDKEELENNLKATESRLRIERDNLKSQLDDMKSSYEENVVLYEAGAISKSTLDDVALAVEQLNRQYSNAAVNYKNQVATLKKNLSDRQVKSPIAGTVSDIEIKNNEDVTNITAMKIVDISTMVAKMKVTSEQLSRMRLGDTAHVYIDGNSEKMVTGKVLELNEVAESSTGLFEVEILLVEAEFVVRSGEYAEIETVVDSREMPVVPKKSIINKGDETFVYTVDKDQVKLQKIEIGITQGEWVEILSGIASGESIVVRGQSFIREGDVVQEIDDE